VSWIQIATMGFSAVAVLAAAYTVECSMLTTVSWHRVNASRAQMIRRPEEAREWWIKAQRLHRLAWPLNQFPGEREVAAKLRAYLAEERTP